MVGDSPTAYRALSARVHGMEIIAVEDLFPSLHALCIIRGHTTIGMAAGEPLEIRRASRKGKRKGHSAYSQNILQRAPKRPRAGAI